MFRALLVSPSGSSPSIEWWIQRSSPKQSNESLSKKGASCRVLALSSALKLLLK